MNLPGRGGVYIVLMQSEEDLFWVAKDSTITAEELQKNVEFWGQKTFKKNQTAPTSPHVVREGFKKNSPHSSKNNLQHIQLSDTTGA